MKNNLYCLYNNKSTRYGDVWASASDAWAEKQTHKMLTSQGNDLEDLELCRVGSIDIENGVITPETAPVRIAWAITDNNLPLRETEKADVKMM